MRDDQLTKHFIRALRICALAGLVVSLSSRSSDAQTAPPSASPSASPSTSLSPSQSPSASPTPEATATPAGASWYDRAYDHWRGLPRRHFATYDADFVYTLHGKRKERKQHIAFRYHDGKCLVVGVPLDSRDRPDKPQITDRCFGPDFSFAFVQQRLGGFKNAPIEIPTLAPTEEPTVQPSGAPATIALVRTRARPYDVTFVGYETKDGKNTVHLALVAVEHPADHILTDMWIDPETLGVVHLRAEAATNPRLARIILDAFYDEDGTTQVLNTVIGYVKLQALLIRVGLDFQYRQSNFEYPDSLPDWYFDKASYDAHQKGGT